MIPEVPVLRNEQIMVDVKIRIESEPVGARPLGTPPRSHGMAVDKSLDMQFVNNQPNLVIGISEWTFHYEVSLKLRTGRHTIEYGVLGLVRGDYSEDIGQWNTTIYVNDRVMAQGVTNANTHLTGTFISGPLGRALPLKIPVLNVSVLRFPPILSMMKGVGGS